MILYNVQLEKKLIRTLASQDSKIAATCLASLQQEDFTFRPCAEIFKRVTFLARERGHLPGWNELLGDSALPETTRVQFSTYKKLPLKRVAEVRACVRHLRAFTKIRKIRKLAEFIAETTSKSTSLDANDFYNQVSTKLVASNLGMDTSKTSVHIGEKKSSFLRIVRKILAGKAIHLIPTGFKVFDRINGGIPRGACFLIAAQTGGGKSSLALILGLQMARYGARVGIVSLEMEKEEVIMRMLANLAHIEMNKLLLPEKLSTEEREQILEKATKFQERLQKIGSLCSIITPDEDVTITDVLWMAKPIGYDVIIIDYINLLRGMDEAEQWRKLSSATRFCKRYASMNKNVIIPLAQLSDEGLVKYSRGMLENSSNCWCWRTSQESRDSGIIEVQQLKARNQAAFPFQLRVDFSTMSIESFDPGEVLVSKDNSSTVAANKKKTYYSN